MAFGAITIWEVQTGGDDTNNGGGFDCGATFPTDGTTDAGTGNTTAPVFSSASYNFVAGDVNAWLFIKAGTNSIPGFYQIASVASNKATLTATAGQALIAAGAAFTASGSLKASTANGIATVGTPTNLTWGIDYSQQVTAQISFTDMVIDATTNTIFTSVAHPVGKNFIGNVIKVTAGTGFTVQRVSVQSTSGTQATVDKSLGTLGSTGGTGGLGGALASPGLAGSVMATGHNMHIKSGTYTVTSASTNVAAGCLDLGSLSQHGVTGYQTRRVDDGTMPLLQASGISTFTLVAGSTNNSLLRNLSVDGATLTSSQGFNLKGGVQYRLKASNCTNFGIVSTNNPTTLVAGFATGCTTQGGIGTNGATGSRFVGCEATANTCPGFLLQNGSACVRCLSYANTGATTDGFQTAALVTFGHCVAYGNGRDGFRIATGSGVVLQNTIAEANTSAGYNFTGFIDPVLLSKVAYYNNGTDLSNFTNAVNIIVPVSTLIAGTGTFFINAASGNFALNATAGAGAAARAAADLGLFPDGTTTGYLDVGAAQHADPAGGGGGGGAAIFTGA